MESVTLENADDIQGQHKALFLLYALNNKALNLASNPVSAQVKAGLCRVTDTHVQALHEKLMATLETAENDLIPVQTSQAAVGTTEPNKREFFGFTLEGEGSFVCLVLKTFKVFLLLLKVEISDDLCSVIFSQLVP